MRKTILLVMVCLMVITLGNIALAKDDIKIGVTMMTLQYPFFQDIVSGIEETAPDNVELNIHDANLDLMSQISAVENFLAQGVDAIILNAVDGSGVTAALDAAEARGVPVITIDMKTSMGTYETYIGSDNILGGNLAGKYAVNYIKENIGGKANVVLLTNPLSAASLRRMEGFKEIVEEQDQVNIIAEKGADTREAFMSAMEDILVANDKIDLVFSYSAQGGLGAYDAIVAAGREDEIAVIGYDATEDEQIAIMENSAYKASVMQFPKELGVVGLNSALKVINGEEIPVDIPVEVGLYTRDGILYADDFELENGATN